MLALQSIRQLDYTVLFARDMARMRHFYAEIMRFPVDHELGPQWIVFRIGANLLVLTQRGLMFEDAPPPDGALSVQLAFRVAPGAVAQCEDELRAAGVPPIYPTTDRPWRHRTLFFRDPDGNVLEIYAEL